MSMKINARGLALVKHFESLYLNAYQDPVGIWTIGWGHTGIKHNDGTVKRGRVITQAEAIQLLEHDMAYFEEAVSRLVKVDLNEDQFSALVSFAFNVGATNLSRSTLLKKLNARDTWGAACEFIAWKYAGGKVLSGLLRRRRSERNLFCGFNHFIETTV